LRRKKGLTLPEGERFRLGPTWRAVSRSGNWRTYGENPSRLRLRFGPRVADFEDQVCIWTAFVLDPHAVGPPDVLRGNRDIRIPQIGRVHHDVRVDMTSSIVAALVVPYFVGREHVDNACLLRGVKPTGPIVFVNSFLDFAGIDSLHQQLATFQSRL